MLDFTPEAERNGREDLPEVVWERILRRPERLLMLDFDGTLAPLRRSPGGARILPEAHDALERILEQRSARLAIVSGRPLHQLDEFLGGLPLHYVGEHGWEERYPNGLTVTHVPTGSVRARLRLAIAMAGAMGIGRILEKKRTGVVMHVRAVAGPSARAAAARAAWAWSLLRLGGGLSLDRSEGGYELRATARGKHTAVLGLLNSGPPDALPVFLGDDTSDEDAFRVLRPRGITIRVGETERPSLAEWRLSSPQSVAAFLTRWTLRVGKGR